MKPQCRFCGKRGNAPHVIRRRRGYECASDFQCFNRTILMAYGMRKAGDAMARLLGGVADQGTALGLGESCVATLREAVTEWNKERWRK